MSSTAGSAVITVSNTTVAYSVGDVIRFTGTASTTNPFGTSATNYYVVSVSGSTIEVSTTPGGTAVNATNTTTASTTWQGVDWSNTNAWSGGVVPNGTGYIASISGGFANSTTTFSNLPLVVNESVTVFEVIFAGSANGDLTLVSGANGTGLYTLTFASGNSSTPILQETGGSNAVTNLGLGGLQLVVAGTQGLILNGPISNTGTLSGSGLTATSVDPSKAIRVQNVNWTGLTGGITIGNGLVQMQAGAGVLTGQNLTVGNGNTTELSGLNLQTYGSTVGTLNGTSYGRIYGASTLTIGGNTTVGTGNATGGNYAGLIGQDFAGTTYATNVAVIGTGTQTISGNIVGTGSVTVGNSTVGNGTLILSGANTYTGTTTIASTDTLTVNGSGTLGGGTYAGAISNAGTFNYVSSAAQTLSGVISGAGALTQSGTGTLTLTGTNTYTGATTISAGTLALTGTGSIASSKTYVIGAGATLNVSGLTTPGYSLAGIATTLGVDGGGTYGSINVGSGALTLNSSTSALTLNFTTSINPGSLTLYSASSVSGDFASVTATGLLSGSLTLSSGTWSGTLNGYNVTLVDSTGVLTVASAIPEPATYAALVGLAGLAFAAYRRRKA